MKKKIFKYLLCLLILFGGSFTVSYSQEDSMPNVIFIFVDDMGYADLSSYGNLEMQTPNIDRLADEGMKFTNAYVPSPICSPSRVGVLTGQHPSRWGIYSYLDNKKRNTKRGMPDYLDPEAPSIARVMQEAGYETAHFGKWHMGGGRDVKEAPLPREYGFDQSLVSFEGLGNRLLRKDDHGLSEANSKLGQGDIQWVEKWERSGIYTDSTLSFIEKHAEDPFYLHFWPGDVHDPFIPKPEWREQFSAFDNHHYKRDFFATLWNLDRQIGRILDKLDELGLEDNTMVVLMSDNGPTDWPYYYREFYWPPGSVGPFRGRKWSLYEGGVRVPFLARWPGTIPMGEVDSTTIISALDLFPTFLTLSEVSGPEVAFNGEDMSRALLGTPQKRVSPLYWEYGREEFFLSPGNPRFRSPNLAIRDGRWKLLMNDDSTTIELYDLVEDQAETHNVAPKFPDITSRLASDLLRWRENLPPSMENGL